MLVANKYDKDTVVSFKLVNGDEVVAKIVEETNEGFTVSKPCTIMPGAQGLGLIQSLFTSEMSKNVYLDRKHVMLHSVTAENVKNHYIKTTTGIEPVTSGGIIT